MTNEEEKPFKDIARDVAKEEFGDILRNAINDLANSTTDTKVLEFRDAVAASIATKLAEDVENSLVNRVATKLEDGRFEKLADNLANAVVKKNEEEIMPGFIQALYGVVIGINSLQFIKNIRELKLYPSMPDTEFWKLHGAGPVTLGELLFKFIFFGFTVLIVAHDWYVYHKSEKARQKGNHGHQFWSYIPQLGSLFFLGQMLSAASSNEMIAWYCWGLLYTVCNFLNLGWAKNAEIRQAEATIRRTLIFIYSWHTVLCLAFGIILILFRKCSIVCLWLIHALLLALTITIVVWLWKHREQKTSGKFDKAGEKPGNDNETPPRLTDKMTLIPIPQASEDKRTLTKFIITGVFILLVIGIIGAIWYFRTLPGLNSDLTLSEVKKIAENSVTSLKIDQAATRTMDSSEHQRLDSSIRDTITGLEKRLAGLIKTIRPVGEPRSIDTAFFNVRLVKLDSILTKLDVLSANMERYLASEFSGLDGRLVAASNDVDTLLTENRRLAGKLKNEYTGDMILLINRINIDLRKLKGRVKRRSAIKTEDIIQLQNKIDSIKILF